MKKLTQLSHDIFSGTLIIVVCTPAIVAALILCAVYTMKRCVQLVIASDNKKGRLTI